MGGGPQPPTLRMVAVKAAVYARALRMLSAAAPVECALLAALLVVQGAAPPLGVWLVREVVDAVVAGRGTAALALLVALWAGAALLGQLTGDWALLVQGSLNERVTARVELALMSKASQLPDLAPFEDPAFYDELQVLTREATHRPLNLMVIHLYVVPSALTLWGAGEQALAGRLGVGDLVLLLQSLALLQQQLGRIAGMLSVVLGHLLFFEQLFRFFDRASTMPLARPGRPTPRPLRDGIAFECVGFRYPTGSLALEAISFAIRPGERVALVGENGAGKSTVAKLLCRLYDPTEGTIRVDGQGLTALDLAGWRARVGAVFQDFGRYQLTLAENVALGQPEALDDRARIERAGRPSRLAC